jgi:hypothetical protein
VLKPGQNIAGYAIEEHAGSGGMGVVFRARDVRLGRQVALKVIAPHLARDPLMRARLNRESTIHASLDHPNVVPLFEAGEADGMIYLAARWVEGLNLHQLVERERPLDPGRATQIVTQVAAALQTAHDRSLIHRDVKPSNVLIESGDHAYLADFGLTRSASDPAGITASGDLLGTLDYVAPELIDGGGLDERVDIYGLGCLLYEALTGEVPFPRDGHAAKLYAHLSAEPPAPRNLRPDIPDAIDAVVRRALSKDPDDRQPTPAVFAGELAAAMGWKAPGWADRASRGEASGASAAFPPPPDRERPRRRTRSLLMAALLGVFLAPPIALLLVLHTSSSRARVTHAAPGADAIAVAAGKVWVAAPGDGALNEESAGGAPTTISRVLLDAGGPVDAMAASGRDLVVAAGRDLVTLPGGSAAEAVRVHLPARARAIALGAGSVWVALADRNELLRVSGKTAKLIHLAHAASAMGFGGDTLWVTDRTAGTVQAFNPVSAKARGKPIAVGRDPVALAMTPRFVWVALAGEGAVMRLDVNTAKPFGAPIPVTGHPVALDGDAHRVWVASRSKDALTSLDARTGRPRDERGTVNRPVAVTLTRDAVWVAGAHGDLQRIARS